jgi:Phosphoadenosine phosphosulfate reductase family
MSDEKVQVAEKVEIAKALIAQQLAQGGLACVTSSFQTECVVLVHMVIEQKPDIPVLFLETGYHFPETLEAEPVQFRVEAECCGSRSAVRHSESDSAGSVLQDAQGGTAVRGALRIRHLVHSAAARTIADAGESPGSGAVQAAGSWIKRSKDTAEDQSAGRVDE